MPRYSLYECPSCGREWQLTPFQLGYYGPPGTHPTNVPDVALVVVGGPLCTGKPELVLSKDSTKEEVAEYLRHHQALPPWFVRSPTE